ncbi:unnamed protein product [Miscanthus lutarioriparius]|uniref:Exocyst subunit Exo70 family protein n=1 Tax=Miscanthus lutarioriparius TaxID=422564 RepID=A0A811SQ45_9POAL|nr:unnamed protein product [Miscanthus lutarioriparius]
MEETLQALNDLISQFLSLDRSLWSSSDDADAFLEAVDELTSTIHGLENTSADHVLLENFDLLLERCSTRLKVEFQQLVGTSGFSDDHGDHNFKRSQNEDDNHTFVVQPVRNFDIIVDALPEGVVTEANRIARRMIAAGFGDTCAETYASARRNFIDESIARLGVNAHFEELCKSTSWEELETQIMRWIPAIRVVFHILIPSERHLCNCIFEEFTSYTNLAFAAACKPFLQLLSFAKVIAAAGHNLECLFRIVDMYDALTDILPVLDEAFDHEDLWSCSSWLCLPDQQWDLYNQVNGCELKILLGEHWIRVISAKVQQWVLEYRRATWGRAIAILETDRRSDSSLSIMLEKLNHFHNFVEAICQVQSRWVLVDKQQAVNLSIMVEELVIPVYRDTTEMLKATEAVGVSYVRPEDVKSRIQRLFKAMAKS